MQKITSAALTAALVAAVLGWGMFNDQARGADVRGLETTRHGVFVASTLPHCAMEDGRGSALPCTWNLGATMDGNGQGLSYVIRRSGRVDYIWPVSPRVDGWHWAGPTSDCVHRDGLEKCPDGTRHPYAAAVES